MRSKMKGLCESFDVRVAKRPFLLYQTNFGRMNNLTHRHLSIKRSEEHTSELQSHLNLVCRLLLEKKKREDRGNARFHRAARADRTSGNAPCSARHPITSS